LDSSGIASIDSVEYGFEKYGAEGLLASSADLGWNGVSAELRAHAQGEIGWKMSRPETEVCVVIGASNSLVTRFRGGVVDRAIAQRGRGWLCRAGAKEGLLDISAPVPQIVHIYLPPHLFPADGLSNDATRPASHHGHSFQDPLVAEIAFALGSELRAQTAGGRLLAETLAVGLAARLLQWHTGRVPDADFVRLSSKGLDRRRLTRVREYIAEHLEEDLTIAQLAKVASLSRFHFARAFKIAAGQSPHQYVSAQRLERAKELLTRGEQSLLDIAVALNFSSQANFTRAFRQSTGMTPGQYRQGIMHSHGPTGGLARRPRALTDPSGHGEP
jgi:AraC family transcriptional regulator